MAFHCRMGLQSKPVKFLLFLLRWCGDGGTDMIDQENLSFGRQYPCDCQGCPIGVETNMDYIRDVIRDRFLWKYRRHAGSIAFALKNNDKKSLFVSNYRFS